MRKIIPFYLLLSISLWACQSGENQNSESSTETEAENEAEEMAPAADNTLTDAEKAEGWQLLFDGKSMDQWRLYGKDNLAGWAIVDGEMQALGEAGPEGLGADIITKEEFENFELSLEWKISDAGNSGIFFNVVEAPEYKTVYATGPEYQLVDDIGFPSPLEDWQTSGANYAMHPPTRVASNPAGTYNLSRIRVENGHVQHWLNNEKVVEYDLWTPEWQKLRDEGKWKEFPDYGKAKKGHIALQDHGNQIWFKNVKVKRL
ncbi:MAG: glycosyl hydrolase [Saprospiraceae bacterium]|nr:MAG: glycosyl hydrolase [Saprospiraceae bacterium]